MFHADPHIFIVVELSFLRCKRNEGSPMIFNPFSSYYDRFTAFYSVHSLQLWLLILCAAILYLFWHTHWTTRYKRIMRQVFIRCNLYTKYEKGRNVSRLMPVFHSFDNGDTDYLVMKYWLRPGLSLPLFEEKKKYVEAAFNSKIIIYGRGKFLFIKIKKQPFDEPGIYPE
jgi:hypothetical protein